MNDIRSVEQEHIINLLRLEIKAREEEREKIKKLIKNVPFEVESTLWFKALKKAMEE